jgi:nucleotide sugar dehydrogenase
VGSVVVVGLGYVGVPLAQLAVARGLEVTGLDTSERIVTSLNAGTSHIDDLTDADIAEMVSGGFRASTDPAVVAAADTVVICVPTPLDPAGGPDLSMVRSAARSIGPHLTSGSLVVLESTTYPGTTDEVLRPILEELSGLSVGTDLALAFSPERVDPGNAEFGIGNTPKVVGGTTPDCAQRAEAFYAQLTTEVVVARGTREAEMSKLLENTYRQVNIALVNEMVRFSHELDIDFWDVIRLARTKPFGFQPSTPVRASAATASRSTRTTSRTASRSSSATRSASWSWPRRSTPACLAMSHSGSRLCSTTVRSRSTGRACCSSA